MGFPHLCGPEVLADQLPGLQAELWSPSLCLEPGSAAQKAEERVVHTALLPLTGYTQVGDENGFSFFLLLELGPHSQLCFPTCPRAGIAGLAGLVVFAPVMLPPSQEAL